jgi:acyl carrier protein
MGLEGLELVLATEETFAIAMPDAVAAAIQTLPS